MRPTSSSSPATPPRRWCCRICATAGRRSPFVGTVPAIKPAAERSRSGLISVLGTPGTVARDYTQNLIAPIRRPLPRDARRLRDAGAHRGDQNARRRASATRTSPTEIAPCFRRGGRPRAPTPSCSPARIIRCWSRTSAASRPGRSDWIDPAPAIARRADQLLRERGFEERFTGTGQARAGLHQRRHARRAIARDARALRAGGGMRRFYFCGLSVSVSRKATMASMSFSDRRGFWPGLRS